jgi:hypothetical protein
MNLNSLQAHEFIIKHYFQPAALDTFNFVNVKDISKTGKAGKNSHNNSAVNNLCQFLAIVDQS